MSSKGWDVILAEGREQVMLLEMSPLPAKIMTNF